LALASRLLGQDRDLLARLAAILAQVLPLSALPVIEETLNRFTRQGFGAGVLGFVLLLLSASNIYLTLQRGADRLWWNRPFGFEGLHWLQLVRRFVTLRLKSFLLLLLVGLLMVFDQLISNLRFFGSAFLRTWFLERLPTPLRWLGSVSFGVDVMLSQGITFCAMLILLWLLPSRRIPLRPLLPGALLVSVALTFLNLLLGRSIVALGLRFQAYGVVGAILVLTLWVWLVGVILYYGQCLSVVLAGRGAGRRSTLLAP
jgi:membrane protein